MRLIDANLLLKDIERSREKNPHGDSKIRANHTIEHDHIAHLVLEQPVAYDVDKVVERLEQMALDTSDTQIGIATRMAYGRVIEMIKSSANGKD